MQAETNSRTRTMKMVNQSVFWGWFVLLQSLQLFSGVNGNVVRDESMTISETRLLPNNYGGRAYARVESISCPSESTTFTSWIAVELHGSLRDDTAEDIHTLGKLLVQAYRAQTAWNCDPYQRLLRDVRYSQYLLDDLILYKVDVLAAASIPEPLVLDTNAKSPDFKFSIKKPFGLVCSTDEILEHYVSGMEATDCPFMACYCPTELLPATVKTSGTTAPQLGMTLANLVEDCQAPSGYGGGKKESSSYDGGKKGMLSSGGSEYSCLPELTEVSSVVEVKPMKPSGKPRQFEATVMSTLSEDPCSLDPEILTKYLDLLSEMYNQAQFKMCDADFRRVESYEIIDICSQKREKVKKVYYDHHGRRLNVPDRGSPFPFRKTMSTTGTSNALTARRGPQGRRLLQDQDIELNQDAEFEIVNRILNSQNNDSVESDPAYFCSTTCSGMTDGITEEDYLEMAKKAMAIASNGKVKVSDHFQVEEGCPNGDSTSVQGDYMIVFNDAGYLGEDEIEQLEEDCVLAYNNYVIEFCPASWIQIRSCTIRPSGSTNGYYGKKEYDDDNDYDSYGKKGYSNSRNNAWIAELRGDGYIVDGQLDPLDDPTNTMDIRDHGRFLPYSPVDGNVNGKHRSLPYYYYEDPINTLPDGFCICKYDVGTGQSPSLEILASFFNRYNNVVEVAPAN